MAACVDAAHTVLLQEQEGLPSEEQFVSVVRTFLTQHCKAFL